MKILVSAESFGYGPITTALNVVKHLKKYNDVQLDFIGFGISMEQAKLSGHFQNFYNCNTYDKNDLEAKKDIITSYDIFFSSENIEGTIFAINNKIKKVYYVDNLMWMWDKIPDELNHVTKFFISNIIPVEKNLKRIGKKIENPIIVGPIRDIETTYDIAGNQLIINIGGASSFLLDNNLISKFYNKLFNEILLNHNLKKFEKIIICGGSEVLTKLNLPTVDLNIIIKTLSNEEYLKEMKKSSHCIMASGLGNFVEVIGKNKNILILPPINYSQLLQIDYYNESNFGFDIITWNMFDFYNKIHEYLDEETGVNLVVENIKKYLEKDYSKKINNILNKYLANSQEDFFGIRKEYVETLDKNAGEKIAKIIYEENRGE